MQTEAIFDNIASRILAELNTAQHSIYIAVVGLGNINIFNTLLQKAKQGVIVKILFSNDNFSATALNLSELNINQSHAYQIESNVELSYNQFCVIDEHTIITGSYTWSSRPQQDLENILLTSGDTVLVQQFIVQFERIRNRAIDQKQQKNTVEEPITKIIKRLEILKNYVILEDEDDIARETKKLQAFNIQQDELVAIVESLNTKQFSQAVQRIDNFIKKNNQLAVYADVDLVALKLEIRHLEHQVNAYDNEKVELEKLLAEFNHRHVLELGVYINRLLTLRKNACVDDALKFSEAERDEREYQQQFAQETAKNINDLNKEQRKAIKKTYRKASQLCHPDRVCDALKDIAEQTFIELNRAYEENNIDMVEQILDELQDGLFIGSDGKHYEAYYDSDETIQVREFDVHTSDDKQRVRKLQSRANSVSKNDKLKTIIESLKSKLSLLENQLITIKDSTEYQTISKIVDWDTYFVQVKQQLIKEIEHFEVIDFGT